RRPLETVERQEGMQEAYSSPAGQGEPEHAFSGSTVRMKGVRSIVKPLPASRQSDPVRGDVWLQGGVTAVLSWVRPTRRAGGGGRSSTWTPASANPLPRPAVRFLFAPAGRFFPNSILRGQLRSLPAAAQRLDERDRGGKALALDAHGSGLVVELGRLDDDHVE